MCHRYLKNIFETKPLTIKFFNFSVKRRIILQLLKLKSSYRFFLIGACMILTSCFNGYNENETKENEYGVCGVIDSQESRANAPSIFKVKCATCHHLRKDGTGPKLIGALKRLPSEIWLRQFITNEDSLTSVGDSLTLEIQKMKPTAGNHNFRSLTNKDLDILIEYIK